MVIMQKVRAAMANRSGQTARSFPVFEKSSEKLDEKATQVCSMALRAVSPDGGN
jgi:hypothetical protein